MTAIAAIPIGLWVNFVSDALKPSVELAAAIRGIGTHNLYFAVGGAFVLGSMYLQFRWDTQDAIWQQFLDTARARRDLRTQLQILEMYCRALERTFGVPVSARLFAIHKEENGRGISEDRMYQVRDVFVEHETFPQETAFIYIPMTENAFVTARAFQERAPKFEVLPDGHIATYAPRERSMVDPEQRWVLCSPILQYDRQGQAREDLTPTGMVVFYGKQVPTTTPEDTSFALALCRDTADLFSVVATPRE